MTNSQQARAQRGRHTRTYGSLMMRAVAAAAGLVCAHAGAADIDLGVPEVKLRWDNTVKYSTAYRLRDQDPALTGPANNDDGDRNFDKGVISSRFDLLSEMDVVHRNGFGARVSAAAWYDSLYNRGNDNPGGTANQASVPQNQFTDATRKLHGRKAEFLDAFVFGKLDLGSSTLSLRLGKHSLIWGESLFFGSNGIAAAQSPVDVIKLLSVPGTQFKEAIIPVSQVSGQLQLTPDLSIGAYYQFHFTPNRLPAVGSYFSGSDVLQDGGEQFIYGPFGVGPRQADLRAKNRGQGGLQMKLRLAETDLGFYAVRYHEKSPQLVVGDYDAFNIPRSYRLAYHEGITAFGASVSHSFGEFNVSAEASIRHNMGLASPLASDLSSLGLPPTDNNGNTGYAVGKTGHFNLNTLAVLPPSLMWNEASLLAEVAWNRVISVTRDVRFAPFSAVDSNSTRDAWGLRAVLEPTYRQVLPGLDLGVPVGLGFAPPTSRSRALGPGSLPPAGGGDVSIGLNGSYLDAWRFTLAYTHYYGKAAPTLTPDNLAFTNKQTLRDRDFIALSVRRTF